MGRGRMYKWGLVVALAIGLILMVANAASAAVFVEGRIIPVDQVIDDDVFIVGDRVVVEGTVRGNLFATGGEVLVNGTVEGSLFAMGQTVQVNGTVRGSAFTGASSVILGPTANVARNLFFGGFALDIQRGASVGQDALVGGYQAQVGGRVAGDLKAALGALEIDGEIGGDVRVDVGDPAQAGGPPPFWTPPGVARTLSPGLRVSEGARVGGKLVYTSPVRQDSAIQTQPRGGIVYQTPQPGEVRRERRAPRTLTWQAILLGLVRWVVARLRDLITLLILGGLLIWLLPALFVQTTEEVRRRPWPCLGWGFLTWVAGFVAAGVVLGLILVLALFLGFVTLGGLAGAVLGIGLSGLGLAFTTFLLLVNYGSKLVVAMTVGRLLLEAIAPRSFARPDYAAIEEGNWWRLPTVPRETIGPLLLGVAIYVLLRGVPLLGWLVGLIVTFFGLGAIALRYADWRSALAKRRL